MPESQGHQVGMEMLDYFLGRAKMKCMWDDGTSPGIAFPMQIWVPASGLLAM